VLGKIFALMEETALMRHMPQRAVEGFFKPLGPIADDQLGGLFRDPDVARDRIVNIAWQGRSVHNLPIVGKVAAVMKRRGMAHRDLFSLETAA
jgi:hypothetical protein